MNRLTTLDVRCLLADLDLAIKYRHNPDLIEECVTRVKDCLLRAALADVEVEPIRRAA